MTKPSNFIMNSDYLTIAQVNSTMPYTVYFPPSTFPVDSGIIKSFHIDREFISPAVTGAVDRIMIEYNGVNYVADEIDSPADPIYGEELEYDQFWRLVVFRKNSNTLVARCTYFPPTSTSSIPTTPSLNFTISTTSFKPPNIF